MESKSLNEPKQGKKARIITHSKKSIALVVFATLFAAAGLTFLKLGASKFSSSVFSLLNFAFIGGVLLYLAGAILLIIGLKNGKLSTLYPVISLSYVWVVLISVFFFEETLTFLKTLGVCIIIAGVGILGVKGDSEDLKSPKKSESSKNKRKKNESKKKDKNKQKASRTK